MAVFRHETGERVIAPEDSPEGVRLTASEHWTVETEKPPRARKGRAGTGAQEDGQEPPQDDEPPTPGSG